jgi:hypothetical protein
LPCVGPTPTASNQASNSASQQTPFLTRRHVRTSRLLDWVAGALANRAQGRVRPLRRQQIGRPHLQPRVPRGLEQAFQQRLPHARWLLPRACRFYYLLTRPLLTLSSSMHAITKQLCPVPREPNTAPAASAPSPFINRPTGIEVLESSHFRIQCFQTQTGTKFLLFTEPQQPNVDTMMKKIYELYADYVMKNPFYTVEMPIRCDKFDRGLDGFVKVRG